jgi:hypothetical protein
MRCDRGRGVTVLFCRELRDENAVPVTCVIAVKSVSD